MLLIFDMLRRPPPLAIADAFTPPISDYAAPCCRVFRFARRCRRDDIHIRCRQCCSVEAGGVFF